MQIFMDLQRRFSKLGRMSDFFQQFGPKLIKYAKANGINVEENGDGNEIYLNSYLQFELNQFFYRKLNGAYSKYRFFSKEHGICEKRKRSTV